MLPKNRLNRNWHLLLFWGFYFLAFFLKGGLSSSLSSELFGIFLAYTIIILVVYFIITYIFIYASQLLLIKCNRLNLWFILGSAIALTLFFSTIIFIITSLDIGLRGFNLGVVTFIGFFAISFAFIYWILLFKQHQKK